MKKKNKPKNTTCTCEEMTVSQWICYLNSKPGVPGPEGPVGPAGPEGAIGPIGPQGVQGPVGPQGPKGDQGVQGIAGPVGPKGDTGAQGVVGPQGPKGDQGSVGPAGPQGSQGAVGPAGPIGPKGDKGDAGPTGATGAAGPQGAKGDQGVPGPQGQQGVPGTQGPQGQAATIAVGAVTAIPCTSPPKITNVGTPTNAVFDFETPSYACSKYAGFNSNVRAVYTENQPLLYDRFTTNSSDIVGSDGGTSFTLTPPPSGYTRAYTVYFTSNMKYSAAPGLASIGLYANGTEIFRLRHFFNDPNQFETVEWTNLVAPAVYEWRVIPGVTGATIDTLDILNNITEVTQLT